MSDLRKIERAGRDIEVQFLTQWDQKPPKYVHCYDPKGGKHFIVEQRMGAWMEVDIGLLVHKLARAICRAQYRKVGLPEGREDWRDLVDVAKAAIEAMREPTDSMGDAGVATIVGFDIDSFHAMDIWRDMIQAALTNSPPKNNGEEKCMN